MIPTALPQHEINILQGMLRDYANTMGFRDGLFHVEARMCNSSKHFVDTAGLVDLVPKPGGARPEPDAFIIRITPRALPMEDINAVARAYGVSYRCLALMNAVGDRERMRALAIPFVGGAQYHLHIVSVLAQKGGVYRSGDVCTAILMHRPDLRENIVECSTCLRDGQEVADPKLGASTLIAYFIVISRVSRREALEVGGKIKELVLEHTGQL